jgi:hypothetical protein
MEGRITTPPTTPGVTKRARQGKSEGVIGENLLQTQKGGSSATAKSLSQPPSDFYGPSQMNSLRVCCSRGGSSFGEVAKWSSLPPPGTKNVLGQKWLRAPHGPYQMAVLLPQDPRAHYGISNLCCVDRRGHQGSAIAFIEVCQVHPPTMTSSSSSESEHHKLGHRPTSQLGY